MTQGGGKCPSPPLKYSPDISTTRISIRTANKINFPFFIIHILELPKDTHLVPERGGPH